jgi:hypothetical protein
MKGIIVDRSRLINILKKNREAHVTLYKKALQGYRIASLKSLETLIKKVKGGKQFELYINLQKPTLHKEEYDTIIGMMEMHSEPTIELTAEDYVKFIEDNWNWRQSFISNATMYSGVSGSTGYSGYAGKVKFAKGEK